MRPRGLVQKCLVVILVVGGASVAHGGNLSLFRAVLDEDINKIESLLSAGVDVNARYAGGMTALHYATALGKDRSVVKALVDAGANVNQENDNGWTPLEMAREVGASALVQVMKGSSGGRNDRKHWWAATAYDSEAGGYGVTWGGATEKAARRDAIEGCNAEGGNFDTCRNSVRSKKKRCVVLATFVQQYVDGTSERIFVTEFGDTRAEALRRLREGTRGTNECPVCEVEFSRCAD